MVDDEARLAAQAVRAEPVAFAVAGADQQVGVLGRPYDLVFDAAVAP